MTEHKESYVSPIIVRDDRRGIDRTFITRPPMDPSTSTTSRTCQPATLVYHCTKSASLRFRLVPYRALIISFIPQARLGFSESPSGVCTTASRPHSKDMAYYAIYTAPIHSVLFHVVPRPETRHPSHSPPCPPYSDYFIPPFILRLRLARPKV